MLSKLVAALCALVISAPSPYVHVDPGELLANSVSATGKDPSLVYRVPSHAGLAFNGTSYRDYRAEILPAVGLPIFRLPATEPTKFRFIVLPGAGSNYSHAGSLLALGRMLHQLYLGEKSKNPFIQWFGKAYPHHALPVEIVTFDLPGGGWAPSLDEFPTAATYAKFIADVVRALQKQHKFEQNYILCRSASCPLAITAATLGMPVAGIISTAGTFPDPDVIQENREDAQRAAEAGKFEELKNFSVDLDFVEKILSLIGEKQTLRNMRRAIEHDISVLGLSGDNDAQTSARARKLWHGLLGDYGLYPFNAVRGHITLKGASHFVFALDPSKQYTPQQPGVQAYYHVFDFIRKVDSRFGWPILPRSPTW